MIIMWFRIYSIVSTDVLLILLFGDYPTCRRTRVNNPWETTFLLLTKGQIAALNAWWY